MSTLKKVAASPTISRWAFREIVDDTPRPEIFDFLSFCVANRASSSAQLMQDLWVLYETGMRTNGYFVEFGAGDGSTHSNTHLLESGLGWTGLLAEPNRDHERALRSGRTAKIDMRCVWRSSGEKLDFLVADDPEFSRLSRAATSDGEVPVSERNRYKAHRVETVSLVDLLEEHRAPSRIDYLSIDTEGTEFDIIAPLDFARWDIELVTIEHNYTSIEPTLDTLMLGNGYARRFRDVSHFDAWYRKLR